MAPNRDRAEDGQDMEDRPSHMRWPAAYSARWSFWHASCTRIRCQHGDLHVRDEIPCEVIEQAGGAEGDGVHRRG